MSIGICGIWPASVFKLPNLRKHRHRIHCDCHVYPVMGSDHIYHHAEDEQRRRELLSACHPPVHPGRKHHE